MRDSIHAAETYRTIVPHKPIYSHIQIARYREKHTSPLLLQGRPTGLCLRGSWDAFKSFSRSSATSATICNSQRLLVGVLVAREQRWPLLRR